MQVPQAERWRRISRMPGPSLLFEEFDMSVTGIQRNHGSSHSRHTDPRTTKNGRQPKRATRVPPNNKQKRGPGPTPAAIIELANPRRPSGQCMARIFEYPGYATDSPIPSTTRTTVSSTSEWTSPATAVALDHRKKPAANTHFTSKRSTSQPERSWQQE